MSAVKMRNIGPKSAAWLRQVGLRTLDDLAAVGTVDAFMRVKRAGFKPGLNLLYAIEGALLDCHWQEVPEERRQELILAADAATAQLPPPRNRPAAGPVRTTVTAPRERTEDASSDPAEGFAAFDDRAADSAGAFGGDGGDDGNPAGGED